MADAWLFFRGSRTLIVLGLSMFTNYAAGMSDEALSHAHTLATASAAAALAQRLLSAVVPALVV